MMSIDVVIVNHRTPLLYHACVGSIYGYFPPHSYEIFGVDTSGTPEAVAPIQIENRGYGNACNVGASKGSRPFILFLNADVEATTAINLAHVERLFEDPSIGIVGPRQVSPDGWIASAGCPPADNGVGYYIRGFREPDRGQYREEALECYYVPGSIMFVRREIWEMVGGLLEDPAGGFSQYYEDTFLCIAARHLGGWKSVYTGLSNWVHHWDASPKPQHDITRYHQGGHSGRQWAAEAHQLFTKRLLEIGYRGAIPPLI